MYLCVRHFVRGVALSLVDLPAGPVDCELLHSLTVCGVCAWQSGVVENTQIEPSLM